MIVWLASYPRSGNTLVRLMLKQVWGLGSYSIYGDEGDITNPAMASQVGHESMGRPFHEAYPRMAAAEDLYLLKTHEIPIDAGKAIYVVRDGRAASRSYCHYCRDFNGITDDAANLRDIILGFTSFGSWSNHLDLWDPLNRPNTLLLRYEDLLAEPGVQIRRISEFLKIEPRQVWQNSFEELSRLEPRYFRAASGNRPEDALAGPDLELFWMLHGPWMRSLQYGERATGVAHDPAVLRRGLYHSVAEHLIRAATIESASRKLAAELRHVARELSAAQERAEGLARQLRRALDEKRRLEQHAIPRTLPNLSGLQATG